MDASLDNQRRPRRRLPSPRWLSFAAVALTICAAALCMWASRLRNPPAGAEPQPTARATFVARATATPSSTARPTAPPATPQVAPVVRTAGPLVQAEDWLPLALAFDTERAIADIAELTKPEYAGRAVGSAGGWLAGDWIAERFTEYGLQPAGDNGSYFQEFEVPYAYLTAMPSLRLVDDDGQVLRDYVFRQDYTVWMGSYAEGGEVEGQVFWVSDGAHDDYDDIDVQGAVVLCRYQYPFDHVLRQALEHGAKAVLLARGEGMNYRTRRTARENAILPEGIPALLVGRDVLDDLLAESGLSQDALSIQYQSLALGTRVHVDVGMNYRQDARGRNVLGVIPGSDPDGADEVLVLGGHYDHMGADPDGTVWGGANDNASGIAVLLEIARLWQEHGFVPKRTVLFAAWDGEEIGLNGSIHYVRHAPYPLESTVGMLQLDMVGAGTPRLAIDAGGLVADQSEVSAAVLGVSVEPQSLGGSDHVPFVGARVPATLYIWDDGGTLDLPYHVPEDDVGNIQPDRLQAAGQLANLVALSLSWDHEELEDRVAALEQAIEDQDLDLWRGLLDPSNPDLAGEQETWLAAASAQRDGEFHASSGPVLVAGDVATSTLTMRYRWDDQDSTDSALFPARWRRHNLEWYYAGPTWESETGQHTVVQHLQQPARARSLVQQADALYTVLVEELGLAMPSQVSVRFYGTGEDSDSSIAVGARGRRLLHALHPTPEGYDQATGWPVADGILLADPTDLRVALVEMALQRVGWAPTASRWLASGLLDSLDGTDDETAEQLARRYVPALLDADREGSLWAPEEMPSWWEVTAEMRDAWAAQAWAMTDHMLQSGGWEVLQEPTTAITAAWRTARLDSWRLVADGIEESLQQRAEAVLAQDQAAFLATVDAENPVLLQEELHWFEDLKEYPADQFAYESRLVGLEGDAAIVDLKVLYRAPAVDWKFLPVHYRARFVFRDGLWLYSDVDFEQQTCDHFVLKYEDPEFAFYAGRILADAERAYAQVTDDLEAWPDTPIEIKLYDQPDLFRFSIYMSMPFITGWNEPGEAIKLNIAGRDALLRGGAGRVIAHELTHAAIFAKGVEHGAIHEGIAEYEAVRFDEQYGYTKVRKYRRQVYDLVRSKRMLTMEDLQEWRELEQPDDLDLFYSVGWDFVECFRRRFTRETFLEWLHLLGTGASFEDAFVGATGVSFQQFDAEWRESVLRGHIEPQDIELALGFSGERALEQVRTLAQPTWLGREAGTRGNEAAAQYVADQFASFGLEPAGEDGTFYQHFALERSELQEVPSLTLFNGEGGERDMEYRVDFREVLGGYAGRGEATREIVFVRNGDDEGLLLGGRVMLTYAGTNLAADAANAVELGAGALLLITDKWERHMAPKSMPLQALLSNSIPVFELTQQAADDLFDLAGYSPRQIEGLPPVLPLAVTARVRAKLTPQLEATAANVLGLLRGSDPQLRDEIILIGAHLDHAGSLPDGTVFPGANNDASGVAVLLEIARLLDEAGFRPRRTVLFAAWNATEFGSIGSRYYAAHPTYPLHRVKAVMLLDQVGEGKGYYIAIEADEAEDSFLLAHLENAADRVESRLTVERKTTSNDHTAFDDRGVPSVLLSWQEPRFAYLPQDSPETLDSDKLSATGRVVALAIVTMASE